MLMIGYHLSKDNYLQYAPFDIVAMDESFRKLYDRSVRLFQLDFNNPPPIDEIINTSKGASLGEAFESNDWFKIEQEWVHNGKTFNFKRYIHISIKDEYLKYTGGELRWDSDIVYGILVHHQMVTLNRENYKDFAPRRMMAIADGRGFPCEIIDEYGEWFLGELPDENLRKVFTNYDDFTFECDETFFHMGLGTGMWVDKSIAQQFKEETQKIYYPQRGVHLLYPQWRELVWKIVDAK